MLSIWKQDVLQDFMCRISIPLIQLKDDWLCLTFTRTFIYSVISFVETEILKIRTVPLLVLEFLKFRAYKRPLCIRDYEKMLKIRNNSIKVIVKLSTRSRITWTVQMTVAGAVFTDVTETPCLSHTPYWCSVTSSAGPLKIRPTACIQGNSDMYPFCFTVLNSPGVSSAPGPLNEPKYWGVFTKYSILTVRFPCESIRCYVSDFNLYPGR